jgi:hypothetical protein
MATETSVSNKECQTMSTQSTLSEKAALLNKTADFYRRSIANYVQFSKTERKPRTKKQLEQRLKMVLQELESLGGTPTAL